MKKKSVLFLITDVLLLILSVYLALSLRWDVVPAGCTAGAVAFGLLACMVVLVSFIASGIYQRVWHYAGVRDFLVIIAALTGGTAFVFFITLIFMPDFFRTAASIWPISLFFLGGTRFVQRLIWDGSGKPAGSGKGTKALIIGAGEAGALIARTLQTTKTKMELKPVGFIDDDIRKKALRLYGLPILGTRSDIPEVVRQIGVDQAIIAIPSATPEQLRAIGDICRKAGVGVKILPSVLDILQGKNLLDQVQELQMEDLLHRNEVEINLDQVSAYLKDQVVLVTGAGGSIGGELCRQICTFEPRQMVLLGRGENSIYEINLKLAQGWPGITREPVIADIRDREKMFGIFAQYRPAVVFHAAAHKHVPLMEQNPDEAFKNNVFGTLNVVKAAHAFHTAAFVLISTDKAVNPVSIMGLTKLIAEMIIRHYDAISSTKFVAVRFGNVLGSRGSVVQLFRRQIATGGPVTVTHPEMRRYFMTIREAVRLVIQAGALARGGEVFVLDMGDQIKIVDLAQDMIRLKGLCPGKDIDIKFTGVRPGEKLSEELLSAGETAVGTQHPKIHIVKGAAIDSELVNMIGFVGDSPTAGQLSALIDLARGKFKLKGGLAANE